MGFPGKGLAKAAKGKRGSLLQLLPKTGPKLRLATALLLCGLALHAQVIRKGYPWPATGSLDDSAPALINLEGAIDDIGLTPKGELELGLLLVSNHTTLRVTNWSGQTPALYSRIRVTLPPPTLSGLFEPGGNAPLCMADFRPLRLVAGQLCALITNSAQIGYIDQTATLASFVVLLEGTLLAVSPNQCHVALQDASGAAVLHLDAPDPRLKPGQKVRILSNALIDNSRLILRDHPAVENDRLHTALESSGSVFLSAGKHPIRLIWFNAQSPSSLEVLWQVPGGQRARIPDSALWRLAPSNHPDAPPVWTNGLAYTAAEGYLYKLPEMRQMFATGSGFASNFSTEVGTRQEDVILEFRGFIHAPASGLYNFSTVSDDGSMLYVDEHPARCTIIGEAEVGAPRPIVVRQPLEPTNVFSWSVVEGIVTFVDEKAEALILNLSAGNEVMQVEISDATGICPSLLPHTRVRIAGVVQPANLSDRNAQPVVGSIIAPGVRQLTLLELTASRWEGAPCIPIAEGSLLAQTNPPYPIARVSGHTLSPGPTNQLWLHDGTSSLLLDCGSSTPAGGPETVEAIGGLARRGSNLVLVGAVLRTPPPAPDNGRAKLPLLTTAEQVKRLSHEDANQGYPVHIRGVVTVSFFSTSFFIRDDTGSVYARWQTNGLTTDIRVGDVWELEGTTFAEFAPNVLVRNARFLHRGATPVPLHPSPDRLMNGSLDTELVEIQGIITAATNNQIQLYTISGPLRLEMRESQPQILKRYEGALVQVRGCLSPERNPETQQIEFGRFRLFNSSISLEEPVPADLWSLPRKHVAELSFYDSSAASLHRVRIVGQVQIQRQDVLFLTDEAHGLRVLPKDTPTFEDGDMVEAVGFPEVGNHPPLLREAIVRRIGRKPLPPAQLLATGSLVSSEYDGRRVRLQARLSSIEFSRQEHLLEMQSGARRFVCRLARNRGSLPRLVADSMLEISGVAVVQSAPFSSGADSGSFELLLNSPTDIKVLSRPSWWTLRHTLTALSIAAPVLLAAVCWIFLLRRQVEERTRQLANEIRQHEQTERQRLIESDRSRIARDLHDTLGSALTQIRFLSIRSSRATEMTEKVRHQMGRISEKALEMVSSLDEIVWAVNPANDSLENLSNYLSFSAEEFFNTTSIRCRLDVAQDLPAIRLTPEVRHNLYLAVREILNNIARHSQATEAWLRIHRDGGSIRITIEDNGRGFPPSTASKGDGLANIRHRLEKIAGRCELQSRDGSGTTFHLTFPIGADTPSPTPSTPP
jgi:signal transduction histidine kinase